VKLSRHLERPGVAAVTIGDVMRAEHVVIFTGAALIVVLLIQVAADVVTYIRIKE
jgi:hypothetical protein